MCASVCTCRFYCDARDAILIRRRSASRRGPRFCTGEYAVFGAQRRRDDDTMAPTVYLRSVFGARRRVIGQSRARNQKVCGILREPASFRICDFIFCSAAGSPSSSSSSVLSRCISYIGEIRERVKFGAKTRGEARSKCIQWSLKHQRRRGSQGGNNFKSSSLPRPFNSKALTHSKLRKKFSN